MSSVETIALSVMTALAALVTGGFVVSMWRRRAEPMATPLLSFASVLLIAVVFHFGLVRWGSSYGDFWIYFVFLFSATALGLWIYFAFQYTGRGRRVTKLVGAAIVTMLFLLVVGPIAGGLGFQASVSQFINLVATVTVLLMQALTIVSVVLLVDETARRSAILFREALAQAGGILVLSFAPLIAGIYQQPVSFPVVVSICSGFFLVAVHRYSLFETLPVARVVGRDRVINEIADPIVVVDTATDIQDVNPASESAFGLDRAAVMGRQLGERVPGLAEPEAIADSGEPTRVKTGDGRTFTVTADRVTDRTGRLFGYLLMYHDVTERQERERRLGVLNQLLIGAVRERIQSVIADAEEVNRTTEQETAEAANRIWATTTDLISLVSRAREVERALTEDKDHVTDAREVVSQVTAGAEMGSVDVPSDPVPVAIADSLLVTILEILLADVIEDQVDSLELQANGDRGEAVIWIYGTPCSESEDGQPVDELAVELARLAAEHAGGTVELSAPEENRTHVGLTLPTARGPDGRAQKPEPTRLDADGGRR